MKKTLSLFVLSMPFLFFLSTANATTSEIVVKSSKSWNGTPLPACSSESPEITVTRIRIPAGEELPMHKHAMINAGYLVQGELTVTTDTGNTLRLEAGQGIIEVVDTWHHGKNEGDGDAEIIVFYIGSPDKPLSVQPPPKH